MAILDVLQEPHPILRARAREVEATQIDDALRTKLYNMADTMYAKSGIGLAANQVGILQRLVVMDVEYPFQEQNEEGGEEGDGEEEPARNPIFLINPTIVEASEQMSSFVEDCLSVPIINRETTKIAIERPSWVRISFLDENSQSHTVKYDGLAATCIQHEIDHLNGILYIDHFPPMSRDSVRRKLKRLARH